MASPTPPTVMQMQSAVVDEKTWVLKRDWTDNDFQAGGDANKAQLQKFEDSLVERLRSVSERELGKQALSDRAPVSNGDSDAGSSGVLARALEPTGALWGGGTGAAAEIRMKVLSDPEILGSSLDMVGAYLKNYEVDKAGAIIEALLPACREKGGLWLLKALNFLATVRMKQARPTDALANLYEVEAVAAAGLRPEEMDEAWEFWETVYRNFGWILSSLDRHEEAIAYANRAIKVKERVGKPASWFDLWDLGRMKATTALHKNEKENILASQAVVTKALWLHKDAEPADLVMRAKIWHSVGECSFAVGFLCEGSSSRTTAPNDPATSSEALGHYRKSLKCFKESHKLFQKTEGRYNPLTGGEAEAVAWNLMKLGNDEEAKQYLLDAVEALSRQQSGWGDGQKLAPALSHAMQGVERILSAHQRSGDREGLTCYFSAVERLCGNICSRLSFSKEHPDASVYEQFISSCAMVMVASGMDDATTRGRKLMQSYLWANPSSTQAKLCSQMLLSVTNGEAAATATPSAPIGAGGYAGGC